MIRLSYHRIEAFQAIKPFLALGLIGQDCWLAGGALRAVIGEEEISDYDLFFFNEKAAFDTREKLDQLGFDLVFKCPEGKLTTHKQGDMKIQCITENFYPQMNVLLDSFDITACRYVTDGIVFYTYYSAVRDTLRKQINLHAIDYPVATMKRIAKYAQKGYTLTSNAAMLFTETVWDRGRMNVELNTRVYID